MKSLLYTLAIAFILFENTMYLLFAISLVALHFYSVPSFANTQAQVNQAWSVPKPLKGDHLNISGVAHYENYLFLATDEGSQLEMLKKNSSQQWLSHRVVHLSNNSDEIDIEALAWKKPYLYVLGSHSAKRKKIKTSLSIKENLSRLQKTSLEPNRQQLFRVEFDNEMNALQSESLSIQYLLKTHPILSAFTGLPSKENGVDIEGLAIDKKGRLLLGFRGPVLRGNLAPVLRLKLNKKDFSIKKSKTLYLSLAGNGIRGLSEAESQFLVLTGAVGDQNTPYQVFLWDGSHNLFGQNTKHLQRLCDLPSSQGKPEGIQFIKKTTRHIEFIIVQDGLPNGQPQQFQCPL